MNSLYSLYCTLQRCLQAKLRETKEAIARLEKILANEKALDAEISNLIEATDSNHDRKISTGEFQVHSTDIRNLPEKCGTFASDEESFILFKKKQLYVMLY